MFNATFNNISAISSKKKVVVDFLIKEMKLNLQHNTQNCMLYLEISLAYFHLDIKKCFNCWLVKYGTMYNINFIKQTMVFFRHIFYAEYFMKISKEKGPLMCNQYVHNHPLLTALVEISFNSVDRALAYDAREPGILHFQSQIKYDLLFQTEFLTDDNLL